MTDDSKKAIISISITVVYDKGTEDLARWVANTIENGVGSTVKLVGKTVYRELCSKGYIFDCETALEDSRKQCDCETVDKRLLIASFTDGMSDSGKLEFGRLKKWAKPLEAENLILQAINGKNQQHNFWTRRLDITLVESNLVATVLRKIRGEERANHSPTIRKPVFEKKDTRGKSCVWPPTPPPPPMMKESESPESAPASTPPGTPDTTELSPPPATKIVKPEPVSFCGLSEEQYSDLVNTTIARLRESQFEHWIRIGVDPSGQIIGVSEADYRESLSVLKRLAVDVKCGIRTIAEKRVGKERESLICGEVMLRRDSETSYIDQRIAICGNVDSGKSTLVGVLTRGMWDDGRGAVRAKVFNHKHEQESGRTSSVSEQFLGFDANGNTVNYTRCGDNDPKTHKVTNKELSGRSAKIVTLYDLAGHERYLKTTVMGMTGSIPDYACIVISANNGIQRMTKEHLGLCIALRIPFFIVITRTDSTPEPVTKNTLETVTKLMKTPGVRKLPYVVRKQEDVVICAKNIKADKIAPIFMVSNVTGTNIDWVLDFINIIPVRKDWAALAKQPKELVIDSIFYVSGVGTVVGGIITKGVFKVNDSLFLGPNSNGQYRHVQIKSIQVKGVDTNEVAAGHDAALALKKEKRSAIRKGNVLLSYNPKKIPSAYWEFAADIIVLYHSTTIKSHYEPVIHCATVRQSARISLVDNDLLRTGDKAHVQFRFLYRPEYMTIGSKLVFREGRTKGLGIITSLRDPVTKEWLDADGCVLETTNLKKTGPATPLAAPACLHDDSPEKPPALNSDDESEEEEE
eukprot:TRINITY_DN2211_c0_g1_i1.p1 TRINITY_DN2211_c0_g1~~TRINITY_DN2211_c0_g1_i1.p1  ORF type:complete len:804 (+),score=150.54 TRINITY_DN2211_c0_g1_i1:79-2490(+)